MIQAFLEELAALGVKIAVQGENLRVRAKRHTLSKALRDQIKARKLEILAFLQNTATVRADDMQIPLAPRDGPLPLSFAQQRLWFLNQLDGGGSAYIISRAFRLRGPLSVTVLGRCFQEIVKRHESLRTVFPERDGQPNLQPAPQPSPFTLLDLRGLAAASRERHMQRLAVQEARLPFHLARGPLLRIRLARFGAQNHLLLVSMHHIICDGWSMNIMMRELSVLYDAFARDQPSQLAPLAIQYADYALWQRRRLQDDVMAAQFAYWERRLKDAPPFIEIPLDLPRPKIQTFRGRQIECSLSPECSSRWRRLARSQDASLYMALLAGMGCLLFHLSGQKDLPIGSTVANRSHPLLEPLIGFFVNTLVMRLDLSGNPSFRELVGRVREGTLEDQAHQDAPFEQVVERLRPMRDPGRTPLFQVMFNYIQAGADRSVRTPDHGLRLEPETFAYHFAKFDLSLTLTEAEPHFTASIGYNTDLWHSATIRAMAEHLRFLLDFLAREPETPLSRIPNLNPAERQRVLWEWNDHGMSCPLEQGLHRLAESRTAGMPDAVAVFDDARALSYAALNRSADGLAGLLGSRGLRPEEPVGLLLDRCPEMMVGILGALKAGAAYVPLNPTDPPARRHLIVADAGIRWVVAAQGHKAPARAIALLPNHQLNQYASTRRQRTDPAQLAYLIYTSGSSGRPKGVGLSHGAVVNHVLGMAEQFELCERDRVLPLMPVIFDFAVAALYPPLTRGAGVFLRPQPHGITDLDLRALIDNQRLTVLGLPAAHWHGWIQALEQARLSLPACLRLMFVGCEKPRADIYRRMLPLTKHPLRWINAYGPTETANFAALFKTETSYPAKQEPLPIGRPCPNYRLFILNQTMKAVRVNLAGQLYIGGPGTARGYWLDPAGTAAVFLPNPFAKDGAAGDRLYASGDLVRYGHDGQITFLGRIGQQIKLRGFRLEPGEIENRLRQMDGVHDARVGLVPSKAGDDRLTAYLQQTGKAPNPCAGDRAAHDADPGMSWTAAALRTALRDRLPSFMIPSAFIFVDHFPQTPSGKLDLGALPLPGTEEPESEEIQPPTTLTEELLANIWARVLGVDRIGRKDDFFELGGHSLLVTRMVTAIREAFGFDLPLREVFENPRLSGLAGRVDALKADAAGFGAEPPIERVSLDGNAPLSFAQRRLWFVSQMEGANAAYNIAYALRLRGPLDLSAATASCRMILSRHEVLRARFPLVEGVPRQITCPLPSQDPALIDLGSLRGSTKRATLQHWIHTCERAPFPLAGRPLVRYGFLHLAVDDHVLLWTMHHMVSDGWSVSIMIGEWAKLYQGYLRGQSLALPPLPIQYADYAIWQHRTLSGKRLATRLAFWKDKLAGTPALLELPTDRPRPVMQTFSGRVMRILLDLETVTRLERLSLDQSSTLFMTLQAVLAMLLARYSGQNDLVLGTPVANRNRRELEGLIGFFTNTLALRVDMGGNPTFSKLLTRIRLMNLEAFAHQDLPFERLVEALRPNRHLAHSPLFQVMFSFQIAARETPRLQGIQLDPLEGEKTTAKFDLTLFATRVHRGLEWVVEYNQALFKRTTIARLTQHFTTLLKTVADHDLPLNRYTFLTPAERAQLLWAWNDTDAPIPPVTLHGLFERRANHVPEAMALVCEDRRNRERHLSYASLNRHANRLARALRSGGVRYGDRVVVYTRRRPEMVAGLLAVLKAGACYVPVEADYPLERILRIFHQTRASVCLTESDLAPTLTTIKTTLLLLDRLPGQRVSDHNLALAIDPSATAYIIFTSGSTGDPKGVVEQHRPAVNLIHWVNQRFQVVPRDRLLFITSLCFDLSVYDIFGMLAAGAFIHVASEHTLKEPSRLAAICHSHAITFWDSAPAALQQLVPVLENLARPGPHMRRIFLSGDWIPLSLPESLRNLFPQARVIGLGGATEATVWSNVFPIDRVQPWWKSIPYGRPIRNARYYLLNACFQEQPMGVAGDLYIGGACLSLGYFGRAALTAASYAPDPFGSKAGARLYRTGDRARFFADGHIEFLGRVDNQVKIRGFRVELGEIEAVLVRCPEVRQAHVTIRSELPGEPLIAYVCRARKSHIKLGFYTERLSLLDHLREQLPRYMLPTGIFVLDTFPVTANGKLDRGALPAPTLSSRRTHDRIAPPAPMEEVVASIWREALSRQDVASHDNFFELGGHSLTATAVISRIRHLLGVEMPLQTFFAKPTIAAVAAFVAAARVGATPPPAIRPRSRNRRLPLSFSQERQWFLAQLGDQGFTYNLRFFGRLEGDLAIAGLAGSMDELAHRHESLRTSFDQEQGKPYQVIHPPGPLPFSLVDLSGLVALTRAQRLAAKEADHRFDLNTAPLARLLVLRLHSREHWLLLTLHHVITDGWSNGVLVREWSTLYRAFLEGRPSPLPEPRLQYADYAIWQRDYLRGQVLETYRSFWKRYLRGAPKLLQLPCDGRRPAVLTPRGRIEPIVLDPQLIEALRGWGNRAGASLFMVLQTALSALLAKYSGQEDIVVATTVANRNQKALEPLIGMFINTLILRCDLRGDPSLETVLTRVRDRALEAYAYQELPIEQVMEAAGVARSASHTPLFQVMLLYQNMPKQKPVFPGIRALPLGGTHQEAMFELTLELIEERDTVGGHFEYNADLFRPQRIRMMARHFTQFLKILVRHPEQRLSQICLAEDADPWFSRVEKAHAIPETGFPQTKDSALTVLDRWLQPMPAPYVGRIFAAAPGLDSEVSGDVMTRATHFLPNPLPGPPGSRIYPTGYLGVRNQAGTIRILGRERDVFTLRGYRIQPWEIEDILQDHPMVTRCLVRSVPIPNRGPAIVAYVVLADKRSPNPELRGFANQNLPDYLVPEFIEILSALPRKPNHAVDESLLPRPRHRATNLRVKPRDEWEQRVVEVFGTVLENHRIGLTDNFFELGGTSVLAVSAINRLQTLYARETPVNAIFLHPTAASLAAFLRENHGRAEPRQAEPRQAGPRQAGPRQAGPRQV